MSDHEPKLHKRFKSHDANSAKKHSRTPLPVWQITIVLLVQFCEPVQYTSVFPFINKQIEDLGTEPDQVGYYVGLIESIFFVTEAIFVLNWSRLSDKIGRKPVLVMGLLGQMISINMFGISTTFLALIASRALSGALNGNIGVCKATMAELTDSTNRAKAFSFVALTWSAGVAVGPMLGGFLAGETFPSLLPGIQGFLKRHPYYLSCAAVGLFPLACSLLVSFGLRETRKPTKYQDYVPLGEAQAEIDSPETPTTSPRFSKDEQDNAVTSEDDKVVPLLELMKNSNIQVAILNYGFLALVDIAFGACFNLFLFTPIELGGLGCSPAKIGVILAMQGLIGGTSSLFVFPYLERKIGTTRLFRLSVPSFALLTATMPLLNLAARQTGTSTNWMVYLLLGFVLFCTCFSCIAYGCSFVFVTASSPSNASLGGTNGLAQSTISTIRAIGPAATTALFAASIQHQLLFGQLVYLILICGTALGWCCTFLLPPQRRNADGHWV